MNIYINFMVKCVGHNFYLSFSNIFWRMFFISFPHLFALVESLYRSCAGSLLITHFEGSKFLLDEVRVGGSCWEGARAVLRLAGISL